jgi:hypothetical protein
LRWAAHNGMAYCKSRQTTCTNAPLR